MTEAPRKPLILEIEEEADPSLAPPVPDPLPEGRALQMAAVVTGRTCQPPLRCCVGAKPLQSITARAVIRMPSARVTPAPSICSTRHPVWIDLAGSVCCRTAAKSAEASEW